jgi:hypothetical protein
MLTFNLTKNVVSCQNESVRATPMEKFFHLYFLIPNDLSLHFLKLIDVEKRKFLKKNIMT